MPCGVVPDAVERRAHVVLEALRGVDGDRHGGAVARHRGLELPVGLDDLEVGVQRLDAAEGGLHAEGGNGEAEEHGRRDAAPGQRTGRDGAGETAPQRVGRAGPGAATRGERQPDGVDLVAEHREDRRQRGGRGDDRDEHDEDRAEGEAREQATGDEHPGHRDDDGEAGDDDGPAGGRPGEGDRVAHVGARGPLLPRPADDEERVVDADGEADEQDQALRVRVDGEDALAGGGGEAERDTRRCRGPARAAPRPRRPRRRR